MSSIAEAEISKNAPQGIENGGNSRAPATLSLVVDTDAPKRACRKIKRVRKDGWRPPYQPRTADDVHKEIDHIFGMELDEGKTDEEVQEYIALLRHNYSILAIVETFRQLGINVEWEIRQWKELAEGKKSTPQVKARALEKLEEFRNMVSDMRLAPKTSLRTEARKCDRRYSTEVLEEAADVDAE